MQNGCWKMKKKSKWISNIKIKMLDNQHVFTKQNWVTEQDVEDFESLIYNDKPILPKIKELIVEIDEEWIESVLVEDEQYRELLHPSDRYLITSFGRIFNIKSKKQIVTSCVGGRWTYLADRVNVNFNKTFVNFGWIYSRSLISQKYKEYGWKAYTKE